MTRRTKWDHLLLYLYRQATTGPLDLALYDKLIEVLESGESPLAKIMKEEQRATCPEQMEGKWVFTRVPSKHLPLCLRKYHP